MVLCLSDPKEKSAKLYNREFESHRHLKIKYRNARSWLSQKPHKLPFLIEHRGFESLLRYIWSCISVGQIANLISSKSMVQVHPRLLKTNKMAIWRNGERKKLISSRLQVRVLLSLQKIQCCNQPILIRSRTVIGFETVSSSLTYTTNKYATVAERYRAFVC